MSKDLIEEYGIGYNDLHLLQEFFIFDTSHSYPVIVDLDFDFNSWSKSPGKYTITSRIPDDADFDFYRSRRKGYIKNKISKILD